MNQQTLKRDNLFPQNIRSIPLEQAMTYLKYGWSVIPVRKKDKKPLIAWKSYQNNPPTIDEVENWQKQYPEANIGIVTGRVSNLVVVDIDAGSDASSLDLPLTYTVKTGRGLHYYYKYPANFS